MIVFKTYYSIIVWHHNLALSIILLNIGLSARGGEYLAQNTKKKKKKTHWLIAIIVSEQDALLHSR